MNFKYRLDPSSKKSVCPECDKKTFVYYIDVESKEYLETTLGRCDRESKCGYHRTPNGNKPITAAHVIQPIKLATYHNDDVLGHFGRAYNDNNFISYLKQYFSVKDITAVVHKYFIGTSTYWNGATIFWQIDYNMNVRAGKVMLYNPSTGKRIKQPFNHINWMHKIIPVNDFVLQQCLFGIHNLCDYPEGSTVCLVESEKTAIIMGLWYPQYLWLATGSKANLKLTLLQPLKKYKIIVYPDKTEYKDWNTKVEQFKKAGYNIICSQFIENLCIDDGSDLADIMI